MSEWLFQYHRVHPTTWVYLSSLLTIAVYFKFSRLWSVRNLDLLGLILLSPGLLMVTYGQQQPAASAEHMGYVWLFVAGGAFLIRLLVDPLMVRRPLLEPNLSVGGQTFLAVSLLLFLMANVVTGTMGEDDLDASRQAEQLAAREDAPLNSLATRGPGYPLLFLLPSISTQSIYGEEAGDESANRGEQYSHRLAVHTATAQTVAILSHLAIVIGIVMIGYRHFDNIKTGIATATLYLLLPYTAQLTGSVSHALPAALMIWAVEAYRRPLIAGILIGMAIGVIYFPVFLLPLWIGFYWQRGLWRFVVGVLLSIAILVSTLALTSPDIATFLAQIEQMFGWRVPVMENFGGFWRFHIAVYRMPVLTAFIVMCIGFAIWPAEKNLGTLISSSAAVMLGTQFWHPQTGGLYMAWYLPLLLLTIFRPNLEDRVASAVLGLGWFPSRKARSGPIDQAA